MDQESEDEQNDKKGKNYDALLSITRNLITNKKRQTTSNLSHELNPNDPH